MGNFLQRNKKILFIAICLIIALGIILVFLNKKGPEEWKKVVSSAPWSTRDSHGSVVFKDKIWLFGGIDGGKNFDGNYGNLPHKSDIWVSENGEDWELVAEDAPWGKRRSLGMAVFNNKIWLLGGFEKRIRNSEHKNDVWISEDGMNWERVLSSAPWSPRSGHSVNVFNDKIWVIGGVNFFERELKNDVWFSENGINWTEAVSSAPWPGRYDHTVTVFKNKLWLMGGCGFGESAASTKDDIWVSENGEDWELVAEDAPWSARHGHTSVVFEDKIWIISGWNTKEGKGLKDVWYSGDGYTWEKTGKDTPWKGREDHTSVVFEDKIWVMGGMDSNWEWRNDVWYSAFSNF